jgi:hypothetical protein
MANLTLTVPDALVPRILAAFGQTDPISGANTPALPADVVADFKAVIMARVTDYEAQQARRLAAAKATTDLKVWT